MTIYFKSGHILKFKCKGWKFTFDSNTLEYTGYSFEEIEKKFKKISFVPSQVVGFTVE